MLSVIELAPLTVTDDHGSDYAARRRKSSWAAVKPGTTAAPTTGDKQVIKTGMRKEIERRRALATAGQSMQRKASSC